MSADRLELKGSFGVALFLAAISYLVVPSPGKAQAADSVALTGKVTSQEEGPMEGILVSAKGAGTNITITVVSDSKGSYSFPRARLKPNKYAVSIRAVGYEISSPGAFETVPNQPPQLAPDKHTAPLSLPVEIVGSKTARLDLKLAKSTDLASQLSKAEWILSFPGTEEQKKLVGGNGCGFCHSLERVAKSKYDADAFLDVIKRMTNYNDGSTPLNPLKFVRPPGNNGKNNGPREPESPDAPRKLAEYLSTLNLSSGKTRWEYPLKTLPRPKGEATKVIYTEYDLPRRETSPHDAVVDSAGMVWYSDFGSLSLGRLNPQTGEVKEWRLPVVKPGAPTSGLLSVEFDKDGNVWLGSLRQAAAYKFDRKTEEFSSWSAPGQFNNGDSRTSMTAPQHGDVDGKVWFDNAALNQVIHRLDLATKQIETIRPFGVGEQANGHSLYGIVPDLLNNLVFTDYVGSGIGLIDAKTLKVSLYPTPTPHARPRRLSLDSQGRIWFGENSANRVGMFDIKTKQFQEWEMPTPWTDPYDVMLDKNGEAWTAGMVTDRVVRLNPRTGKMVEYLLPRPTQTRRVFVDNSKASVAFWVGSNLGASIVKLEPLE